MSENKKQEEIDENIENKEQVNNEEQAIEEEKKNSELEVLQNRYADLDDKYHRLYADFENFRKRTAAEKTELILNGSADMIKTILPIIDDFERALPHLSEEDGVQLIYNKLMKALEQKGLKPMEAKGVKFDEQIHSAIMQVPAESEEMKGIVVEVVEKGYYLNDKVLRYAKVVVAC